ncbi:glycosyltransferase [Sphingobacteruim zhuxiongii]|nr:MULTISPECIES: glycosyltransferase [unclassified Sphingobacterium]
MSKRVLVIGLVWPEPTSSAAGWRMLELINNFLLRGYEMHFACAACKSEHSFPLIDLDVKEHIIQLNDSSFDAFIETLQPDIVLFDRFMIEEQYSWRVKAICPTALLILDTEDLHFIRYARQEAYKSDVPLSNDLYYNEHAKRELASILRCDMSLIISTIEIETLKSQLNIQSYLLQLLPFFVGDENPMDIDFSERKNFVFIGNFIHEPNWRTVLALKELWPKIRKALPAAELHIYGAYPSQKVWELNKPKEGFIIKGRATNAIESISKYRALIAPIPFGAGLKGKFIDALRAGTPSVTSAIGAEGFAYSEQWNGYIVEDVDEFVEKCIRLYEDQLTWEEAASNGRELLNKLHSGAYFDAFFQRIEYLKEHIEAHRRKNILGQILWTNQFSATKYMSLWIEAKNKQ